MQAASRSACRYRWRRRLAGQAGQRAFGVLEHAALVAGERGPRGRPWSAARRARILRGGRARGAVRPCRAAAMTTWSTISGRNSSIRSRAREGRRSCSACSRPMAGIQPGRAQGGYGLAEDDRVPVGQRRVDDVFGRLAGAPGERHVRPGAIWPRAAKYCPGRGALDAHQLIAGRRSRASMASSWSICPAAARTASALSRRANRCSRTICLRTLASTTARANGSQPGVVVGEGELGAQPGDPVAAPAAPGVPEVAAPAGQEHQVDLGGQGPGPQPGADPDRAEADDPLDRAAGHIEQFFVLGGFDDDAAGLDAGRARPAWPGRAPGGPARSRGGRPARADSGARNPPRRSRSPPRTT